MEVGMNYFDYLWNLWDEAKYKKIDEIEMPTTKNIICSLFIASLEEETSARMPVSWRNDWFSSESCDQILSRNKSLTYIKEILK
jgi:hypothetical protein